MKLISLGIGEKFRSLHAGFTIEFHNLAQEGLDEMSKFQPFCFAGLNGSGKSNVLEALASIFYHLELCVAKFRPESLEKHFRRVKCSPDAFELKYLANFNWVGEKLHVKLVTISKDLNKEPVMFVEEYGHVESQILGISLYPSKNSNEPAPGKIYLPEIVVGYSSGENEILSLPFRKNRLVHFDEYKEANIKNLLYKEPETSLIYIDSEMSQAVLLSILLFESKETLQPLENELNIEGLRSFRMNLNLHPINDDLGDLSTPLIKQIAPQIKKLQNCATSWFIDDNILWLDFFVNEQTKAVFKNYFKNSFELFRFFQILYELNSRIVDESIKEEVYSSKGYYTDGKLPKGSPEQNVFFFLDYLILKRVDSESDPIELLLRNFSDGEHQFLHTIGICLMLKDRRSILLLDEPETHFNPGWRAKFIKVLNDSIKASGGNNLMKEVLLSSHSPFIISDCMPNNVILFEKNEKTGKIVAQSARNLGIETFGTSIEEISEKLFKYSQSIGEFSNSILEKIDFNTIKTEEEAIKAKKEIRYLGDSIEKDLILARLNQFIPKIKKD